MLKILSKPLHIALLTLPLLSACGSDDDQNAIELPFTSPNEEVPVEEMPTEEEPTEEEPAEEEPTEEEPTEEEPAEEEPAEEEPIEEEPVEEEPVEEFSGNGLLHLAGQSISGMYYETTTESGITDENGQFNYAQGESITFTLAGLPFGTVEATPTLEVSDFESEALPSSYADFERYRQQTVLVNNSVEGIDTSYKTFANPQPLDRLANRLFLLNALDSDKQIVNGIQLDIGEQTTAIFSKVALPINLNTTEFVGRMKSRAVLLDHDESVTGFSALASYLAALNINISYPEVMCSARANTGSTPENWSVNYKNNQQQTILVDNFTSCAPLPDSTQAAEYAAEYSTDNKLRNLYLYDEQGRMTHEYRDTDGTAENYNRLYLHEFSTDDGNSVEAVSYYYDGGETKVLNNKTTYTYLPSGLLYSKFVEDDWDVLTVYGYNEAGSALTETIYNNYDGQCTGGDLSVVTQTNTLTYYDSGLLKQRSDEGMCATNTYDYSYNDIGQTLTRFHNVDGATDTNPETISYEYERFASFSESADLTFYSQVSRSYDGSLTNNQYDYAYSYDDESRLIGSIRTSIDHKNSPDDSSVSPVTYTYNDAGQIEKKCWEETCDYEILYGYTAEGLIDSIATSYGGTLESKTYYQYNEQNLVVLANSFRAGSVDEALNPINIEAPDFVTTIEYLPSGAISVIHQDGNSQYFKNPDLDNSSDENGYYQWFNLDLGEHLSRELSEPRSFAGGGDT